MSDTSEKMSNSGSEKPKTKTHKSKFFIQQTEDDPKSESDSIEQDSQSEEIEDSEENVYQEDGFLVPDDEVSEEEVPFRPIIEKPKEKKSKKKLRKRLRKKDREDLDLIQDHLEQQDFQRPMSKPKLMEDSEDISDEEREHGHDESGLQTLAAIFEHESIEEPAKEKESEFEPAEKKERFNTREYNEIIQTDIPERLQIRLKYRENPEGEEIIAETDWLVSRFIAREREVQRMFTTDSLRNKVNRFLRMYRVEKNEITYIQVYKIHLLEPELKPGDIWELEKWDCDWSFIWESKSRFINCIRSAQQNTSALHRGERLPHDSKILRTIDGEDPIPSQIWDLLNKGYSADFAKDIQDIQKWIDNYIYTFKESSIPDVMRLALNYKIPKFLQHAGINPIQLSENMKKRELIYKSEPSGLLPETAAFDLLGDPFKDEAKVISVSMNMAHKDIASLPWIRQFVREEYRKYVWLYTRPTEAGKLALELYHPQYGVKNLEGKPFKTIDCKFWADVWKAKNNDWIEVNFEFEWKKFKHDKILPLVQPLYLNVDPSDTDLKWNKFKLKVLKHALTEMYKDFADECYNELCNKTEEYIIDLCKTQYSKLLLTNPLFSEEDTEKSKILVLVTDQNEEFFGKTVLIIMDYNGNICEINYYRTLACRSFESLKVTDKEMYNSEKKDITRIITTHNPFAAVVGANCLHSLNIKRYMNDLFRTRASNADPDSKGNVYMCSLEIPKIFSGSQRAKSLFPQADNLLKAAISLGRFSQFPLAETLALASDPNENLIFLLNLDPMQKLVNSKRLEWQLENVACSIVCKEQVDINRILTHSHLQSPLAYIAGLGPAKAFKLLEMIFKKFKGKLKMRVNLLTKKCLTLKVYENACGFIFIKRDDSTTEPLDSTRIHPEQYELAYRIAKSALDSKGFREEEAISRIMREPALIKTLDLQSYGETLEKYQGLENMKAVFDMIKTELEAPSKKSHKFCNFPRIVPFDLLYLISGETKETLAKDKLVNCSVIAYDDKNTCLVVRLESGLRGSIDKTDILADKIPTKDEMKMFIKGMSLTARVLDIQPMKDNESFRIKLSILPLAVKDHSKYLPKFDEAFQKRDEDWNEKAGLEDDDYRQGQKYVPRVVNHPRFKNIGLKTACEYLEDKNIGECIFRPSSRGQDHLTCTWKFYENVFAHLDVVEDGKPAINMLGTKFRISDETYESLQEIIDRYIGPCEKLTKEAINNSKFRDQSTNIIQLLKQEKRLNPNRIPYYFTISEHYPQFLLLQYLPKEKTVTEYIKVKPRGLFFHEAYHTSLNYLIGWFKRHQLERNYQLQLQKTKPPIIDTTSHLAIKGRQEKPMTPLHPSQNASVRDEMDDLGLGDRSSERYDRGIDAKRGMKRKVRGEKIGGEKREDKVCKKCGAFGHFSKDCLKGPVNKCYNCEKEGHFAKECPNSRRSYDRHEGAMGID